MIDFTMDLIFLINARTVTHRFSAMELVNLVQGQLENLNTLPDGKYFEGYLSIKMSLLPESNAAGKHLILAS